MTNAIRSEFRKFFTTRLWWGMAIGVFVAGAGFAALFGYLFTSDALSTPGAPDVTGDPTQVANSIYTGGLAVGSMLMLTIGVLQIGSEYRHKTITSTFLATPNRLEAMLAKVVALLGIGVIYGLINVTGSVSVGALFLTSHGDDAFPDATVYRTLALSLLVLGLWALIGLGIGILIPNQVAAILIGIGFAFIVEPLLVAGLNAWQWGREHLIVYLPSQAANEIVNGVSDIPADHRLSWWAAALVLTAYAVVTAGLGTWRTTRQDIT